MACSRYPWLPQSALLLSGVLALTSSAQSISSALQNCWAAPNLVSPIDSTKPCMLCDGLQCLISMLQPLRTFLSARLTRFQVQPCLGLQDDRSGSSLSSSPSAQGPCDMPPGCASQAEQEPPGQPSTVRLPQKVGPSDFELLRVVGQGSFGKASPSALRPSWSSSAVLPCTVQQGFFGKVGPFAVTSCDNAAHLQAENATGGSAHDAAMAVGWTDLSARLVLLHHLSGCSSLQCPACHNSGVQTNSCSKAKPLLTQRCSCCRCFRCARRTPVTSTP